MRYFIRWLSVLICVYIFSFCVWFEREISDLMRRIYYYLIIIIIIIIKIRHSHL